jgi:hypothetical protein
MVEIRIVTTLQRKRRQIAASIKLYERQLTQTFQATWFLAVLAALELDGDLLRLIH